MKPTQTRDTICAAPSTIEYSTIESAVSTKRTGAPISRRSPCLRKFGIFLKRVSFRTQHNTTHTTHKRTFLSSVPSFSSYPVTLPYLCNSSASRNHLFRFPRVCAPCLHDLPCCGYFSDIHHRLHAGLLLSSFSTVFKKKNTIQQLYTLVSSQFYCKRCCMRTRSMACSNS